MAETAFDEWIAARYETLWPELFAAAVVIPRWTSSSSWPATDRRWSSASAPDVPALRRLPPGETRHVFTAMPDHVGVEEYDVANQLAVSCHWWTIEGRLRTFSSVHRYVWPAELDLMARSPGCACAIAGPTGTARPSPARAATTSLSGRSQATPDVPAPTHGVVSRRRSRCRGR
jgi:hypothetical protein